MERALLLARPWVEAEPRLLVAGVQVAMLAVLGPDRIAMETKELWLDRLSA